MYLLRVTAFLFLLCVVSFTCVGQDVVDGMEVNCGNDQDDDGDGFRDCNDPDCFDSPSCTLYCNFDTICDMGENNNNCPNDCQTARCGNGACETGETAANCAADCGGSSCGNGVCDAGETSGSCPADCSSHAFCGNGVCEVGENHDVCPEDCPVNNPVCGNLVCEAGESVTNCPQDCSGDPVCGNGVIEGEEVCDNFNLGTATCVTLGFDGGDLACLVDCGGYDTSGCSGGSFQCIDVLSYSPPDEPPCDVPDQTQCLCEGCVNDGVCFDSGAGLVDDCICPDCATDALCSDPSRCIDDGECNPYGEGCVCVDCVLHPMCQ